MLTASKILQERKSAARSIVKRPQRSWMWYRMSQASSVLQREIFDKSSQRTSILLERGNHMKRQLATKPRR